MAFRLRINGIDQIERSFQKVALVLCRIRPDRKEDRTQMSGAGFVEADEVRIAWIGGTDIVVLVQKSLWGVFMCIDCDIESAISPDRGVCGIAVEVCETRTSK